MLQQSFCAEAKRRAMPVMKACATQAHDADEEQADLSVPLKAKKKKLPKIVPNE